MSLDLRVVDPGPEAARLLEGLEGAGDERYLAFDSLVATFLTVRGSIEVGVAGHDAPPEQRARDFEQLLELLDRLGRVEDAHTGRALDGPARAAATRSFAQG